MNEEERAEIERLKGTVLGLEMALIATIHLALLDRSAAQRTGFGEALGDIVEMLSARFDLESKPALKAAVESTISNIATQVFHSARKG